ncbi:MAG: bifunctional folylpolyglutamate synthase/dihydrofolate synthase [Acidimicrobiia bacterium]
MSSSPRPTEPDPRGWLEAHVNLESLGVPPGRRAAAPTLERIRRLVELLGSPQLEYPALHLTGTNGKTSVARMSAALLAGAGLSVGSYTSPHLQRVNERIAWNGEPVGDEELDELLATVALVEEFLPEPPSYFEILTAVALRYFDDIAVNVAVIEVGVGGTWDATNIIDAEVAVITNVSVDHVEYLGPTRREIAAEKAGIVMPGATLVLGETDPELVPLFVERDAARVLRRGADFGAAANRPAHGGRLIELWTPDARYENVYLPLHGAHQADNAAAALAAAEAFLQRPLGADLVTETFAAVRTPGRLEVAGHAPLTLLDGAHNVAGATALRDALDEEFAVASRTLVVGFLREKEPHEMLTALGVPAVDRLVCTRPPSSRALDAGLVAEAAIDLGMDGEQVAITETVAEAVARAVADTPADGQIVITGSLYTVGAARDLLVH